MMIYWDVFDIVGKWDIIDSGKERRMMIQNKHRNGICWVSLKANSGSEKRTIL